MDRSKSDLLSDDAARGEVERRVAVGVVQVEHVDGVPGERVEERLLRGPRLVAPQLPPEIPGVEPAPEVAAEEEHERACTHGARPRIDQRAYRAAASALGLRRVWGGEAYRGSGWRGGR